MINNTTIKRLSLLVAISAILAGCSSSDKPAETLLGDWSIKSIQGDAIIKKSTASLSFESENKLSGSASCNNLSSSYQSQNSSLTIGAVATTRKMCRSALMEQESHLLRALSKVKRFQLHNGQLSMYDQKGSLQIQANRLKP